jgi:ATP-binding cassette subfamily B protein
LLPADRRRRTVRLLGLMLLAGMAELATVGSVVPFLAVLTEQASAPRAPSFLPVQPGSVVAAAALFAGAALITAAIRLLLSWNTLSALREVQDLVWGVLLPTLQGASAALMALLILAGLIWLDAWAAVVAAACFAAIYAAVSLTVRRRMAGYSKVIAQAYEQRVRMLGETLGAIRDIIIAGSYESHLGQFRSADCRLARARARLSFLGTAPRFVIEALGMIAIALLAVILAARAGGIVPALPLLGALALGAQRLLPLFQQVYHSWSALAVIGWWPRISTSCFSSRSRAPKQPSPRCRSHPPSCSRV